MINFLKTLFVSDPVKKIQMKISQKHLEAVFQQRNGNLRAYANIMKEIEDLEEELQQKINENR